MKSPVTSETDNYILELSSPNSVQQAPTTEEMTLDEINKSICLLNLESLLVGDFDSLLLKWNVILKSVKFSSKLSKIFPLTQYAVTCDNATINLRLTANGKISEYRESVQFDAESERSYTSKRGLTIKPSPEVEASGSISIKPFEFEITKGKENTVLIKYKVKFHKIKATKFKTTSVMWEVTNHEQNPAEPEITREEDFFAEIGWSQMPVTGLIEIIGEHPAVYKNKERLGSVWALLIYHTSKKAKIGIQSLRKTLKFDLIKG